MKAGTGKGEGGEGGGSSVWRHLEHLTNSARLQDVNPLPPRVTYNCKTLAVEKKFLFNGNSQNKPTEQLGEDAMALKFGHTIPWQRSKIVKSTNLSTADVDKEQF